MLSVMLSLELSSGHYAWRLSALHRTARRKTLIVPAPQSFNLGRYARAVFLGDLNDRAGPPCGLR
jgi:hypothetical protein